MMPSNVLTGTIAGAAGTVALDTVTYLDMVIRGRSSSDLPGNVAGSLAQRIGVRSEAVTGESSAAKSRRGGLGAIMGYGAGVGIGAAYGLLRPRLGRLTLPLTGALLGMAAMAASDVPAVVLRQTDMRTWGPSGWISDVVPHLVYGYVTALTLDALGRQPLPRRRFAFR